MRRAALARTIAVLTSLLSGATAAAAQDPSVLLSAEHWAVQAAWRAEAAGLLTDFSPAQRLVSATLVEKALREASREALGSPDLERMTAGWLERFLAEFPGLADEGGSSPPLFQGASAGIWYEGNIGGAAPGIGIVPPLRTGERAIDDPSGPGGDVRVALQVASRLSLQIEPRVGPDGLEPGIVDLTAAAGSWTASIGRQAVGYGWANGGQAVLSGTTPFDRIEVATRRPLGLPGWLRYLGPTTFHAFFSRLSEPRHPGEPFLWGARFSVRPHSRFTLGVNRAAQFGGDGSDAPINVRNVFNMLIGSLEGLGFENQIVSVSGRLRLPSERLVPLTAYLEWGAEDAAGAWIDIPGRILGLEAPYLPGLPQLSLGAEFATFPVSCCGNPPWYRHGAFVGGWATDKGPLGHPMGGNGRELAVRGTLDLSAGAHRLRARAFHRDRGPENLYLPGRDRSLGLEADMTSKVRPGFDVFWSLRREAGTGWADETISVGGRMFSSVVR